MRQGKIGLIMIRIQVELKEKGGGPGDQAGTERGAEDGRIVVGGIGGDEPLAWRGHAHYILTVV